MEITREKLREMQLALWTINAEAVTVRDGDSVLRFAPGQLILHAFEWWKGELFEADCTPIANFAPGLLSLLMTHRWPDFVELNFDDCKPPENAENLVGLAHA